MKLFFTKLVKDCLLVVLLEVKRNPGVCFKNHATTFALISVVDIVRLSTTASVLAWISIIYGHLNNRYKDNLASVVNIDSILKNHSKMANNSLK